MEKAVTHRFRIGRKAGLAFVVLSCISANAESACFVDQTAGGRNDGSSWVDAYTDLQSALGSEACNEIWVAKGVYKPSPTDTSISFEVRSHVQVYGGFVGRETTREQRDVEHNVTVLSGDIGNDDANATTTQIDSTWADIAGSNTEEVVLMDGTSGHPIDTDTTLDGFTITAGSCDSSLGGGLICIGGGAGGKCNPTLRNLIFSGNGSDICLGGAVFSDGNSGGESSPQFSQVTFYGNAAYDGGAVYADGSAGGRSNPSFTDVSFGYNWADQDGGALYVDASSGGHIRADVMRATFDSNDALRTGAFASQDSDAGIVEVSIDSSTFQENASGGDGGAMRFYSAGGSTSASLVNSTFYRNEARHAGGAIDLLSEPGSAACGGISVLVNNTTMALNAAVGNMLSLDDAKGGAVAVHAEPGCMADARVMNSILWGNYVVWDGPGQEVWLDSGSASFDHNVVEHGCPAGTSCTAVSSSDPLLGAFGYYFAPTMLLRPGMGGSAVDAGDDSTCASIDQRGFSRPQGSHCDLGAVEMRRPSDDVVYPPGF
jgi:hypothetical protein